MSVDAFLEMLVVSSVAGGLLLLGLARVLLTGRSLGARVAAAAGAAVLPALGPVALGYPGVAIYPVALVAGVAVVAATVASERVTAGLLAGLRRVGRPGVQAAALTVGGGALLTGAVARYEMGFEAEVDRDMDYMLEVTWKPPLRPADETATTDAGRPVKLLVAEAVRTPDEVAAAERRALDGMGFADRLIRVAPADDGCNCHGWVFTGGRYWLGPEDVEHILADNGYQPVSDPLPGDLVIYRDRGVISHTAVVRAGANGGRVLVAGKWGWIGAFMHAPDGSCYGRNYTFYRGPRENHLLVGLGGRPAHSPRPETRSVAADAPDMVGVE